MPEERAARVGRALMLGAFGLLACATAGQLACGHGAAALVDWALAGAVAGAARWLARR